MSDETEAGRVVPAPGTPDDAAGDSPRVQPDASAGADSDQGVVSMAKSEQPLAEADGASETPATSVRESALVGAAAGSALSLIHI